MNLLAHAFLSFQQPDLLVGNMISDFVKGSAQYTFSSGIQSGIKLHRHIDLLTDTHPATAKAKEIFRPAYRLYSAPIMDVIYDHYLANDSTYFSDETLRQFSFTVYHTLDHYAPVLPARFLNMLTYMKADNWLYHYRTIEGIERSLRGLTRRSNFMKDYKTAVLLFTQHYDYLQECYDLLINDLHSFASDFVKKYIENTDK